MQTGYPLIYQGDQVYEKQVTQSDASPSPDQHLVNGNPHRYAAFNVTGQFGASTFGQAAAASP